MANQQGDKSQDKSQAKQQSAGTDAGRSQQGQDNVHGEGNYQASRDYNERTKRFIESGKVDEAARAAEPGSEAEAVQMAAAEAEGKRHAKEEDPALSRKSQRSADDTTTPMPGKDQE